MYGVSESDVPCGMVRHKAEEDLPGEISSTGSFCNIAFLGMRTTTLKITIPYQKKKKKKKKVKCKRKYMPVAP